MERIGMRGLVMLSMNLVVYMWIVFVANAEFGVEETEELSSSSIPPSLPQPSLISHTISSSPFDAYFKLPKTIKIPSCLVASTKSCLKIAPPSSKKYIVCTAVLTGSCLKILSDSIFDCTLGCANNAITTDVEFDAERVEGYLETCHKNCDKNYYY